MDLCYFLEPGEASVNRGIIIIARAKDRTGIASIRFVQIAYISPLSVVLPMHMMRVIAVPQANPKEPLCAAENVWAAAPSRSSPVLRQQHLSNKSPEVLVLSRNRAISCMHFSRRSINNCRGMRSTGRETCTGLTSPPTFLCDCSRKARPDIDALLLTLMSPRMDACLDQKRRAP